MKTYPLISAILITYHRDVSVFIRSLNSILSQTYGNVQIIVVYTGINQDKLESMTNHINSLDGANIQLILIPNGSSNKARNIGFKASNGNYIAFLDDDDEWAVDKLEKQLEAFGEDISMVYSNYYSMDAENHMNTFFPDAPDNCNLKTKILGENLIGCTSMPLISSKAFTEAGGFDEAFRANQEWDLWIRILQENNAAYSPSIAGIKHHSEKSITGNKYRRASGWIRLLMKHSGKYGENKEELAKATKFFALEMLSKKMYVTGFTALAVHSVSKWKLLMK